MRIPDTLLFELFDCAFGVEPKSAELWRPAVPPSAEHVQAIETDLGIRLPSLLLDLAIQSKYFARWFAELGPDRSSALHILTINNRLVDNGKSENLIVINHGYDGDCVGMIQCTGQDPEATPMVQTLLDLRGDGRPSEQQVIAADFRAYLEDLCIDLAPRSRVKARRRRAKRLLSEWRGSQGMGHDRARS